MTTDPLSSNSTSNETYSLNTTTTASSSSSSRNELITKKEDLNSSRSTNHYTKDQSQSITESNGLTTTTNNIKNNSQLDCLSQVKKILLVLSGKGGVGKSTVTTQLALSLWNHPNQFNIGVLDIDLCGPSLPRMFGVHKSKVFQSSSGGWVPIIVPGSQNRLKVMSIGVLLPDPDDAVVWRGPKKNAMIRQFLNDVHWGACDFLIIDTPPGTSDEHISIIEALKDFTPKAAILVTTPQMISTLDVMKEVNFCEKVSLPMIGILENMSGFQCPHCKECTHLFSKGGGPKIAQHYQLPFIGSLPMDPSLGQFLDCEKFNSSLPFAYAKLPCYSTFCPIRDQVVEFFDSIS